MQPGLPTRRAKPILMDRFATQATNVPPKVINLIRIINASAQATKPMPRKSVPTPLTKCKCHKAFRTGLLFTRVRCLDFSISFSQNSKLLSPRGLFVSSINPKASKTLSNTWHHHPLQQPILRRFPHPQSISSIAAHSKSRHFYSLSLLIHLFPQRNYQILRSLSPSRMPLARLNLTAI